MLLGLEDVANGKRLGIIGRFDISRCDSVLLGTSLDVIELPFQVGQGCPTDRAKLIVALRRLLAKCCSQTSIASMRNNFLLAR
jgi:hypothetical protein